MMLIYIGRLFATFLLALLFGLERQRTHKPIGFGTFTFVATGSCALAITSVLLSPSAPVALLGSIVSGIGFLGAGALIKTNDKIFGVTTAASIWLFAIFGILLGTGELMLGVVTYSMIWAVVLIDRYLESNGIGSYQRKITIITNSIINEREIRTLLLLGSKRFKLIQSTINKKDNKMTLVYLIEGNKEHINAIPKKFFEQTWFESCQVE